MRMRWVACVASLLIASAAGGETLPARAEAQPAAYSGGAVAEERIQVGAARHWAPARFRERLSLGLGWSIPGRLYDADGRLLTTRSLLFRGRDIGRTGLYLALRF